MSSVQLRLLILIGVLSFSPGPVWAQPTAILQAFRSRPLLRPARRSTRREEQTGCDATGGWRWFGCAGSLLPGDKFAPWHARGRLDCGAPASSRAGCPPAQGYRRLSNL